MKITYITPSGIPSRQANTVQVMKMCEAFADQGHDVELLCPNNTDEHPDDVFERYGVEPIFKLRRLPWRPLNEYQFTVMAAVSARRSGADLVYGRSIAGCYFSSLLGLDVAYESHVPADDTHPITDRMFRSLMTDPNLVSLVVITANLERYYMGRYDGIEATTCIAPDAAKRQDGTPIAEISTRDGQQVGYVGHLYEGKGIGLIVDLAREVSEATFHVVGGTEADIERWRTRGSDVDGLEFHGYVQPAAVEDYLASFDAVLAPYQRNVRGAGGETDLSKWMSPLKIFEYMSAGVPIVCSDLPVLREVLEDRTNALLRDPDDLEQWAKALAELRENPELCDRLVANARREFDTQYSFEARAEHILEHVRERM